MKIDAKKARLELQLKTEMLFRMKRHTPYFRPWLFNLSEYQSIWLVLDSQEF